jgi:hypothetical protein
MRFICSQKGQVEATAEEEEEPVTTVLPTGKVV